MNITHPPLIGEVLPSMKIHTTHGDKNLPEDYAGKWLILFSHPGDFTPVCTTEFVSFAKKHNEFHKMNCELLGLSIDQVFSHMKWDEWIEENLGVKIPFPVIADPTGTVAASLGIIQPENAAETIRALFIIDPNSVMRLAMLYPPEIGRSVGEVIRALKALQVADLHKVAIPANWPENEFLGNRVIIPPAKDIQEAEKLMKEYEHYDWWFCHTQVN